MNQTTLASLLTEADQALQKNRPFVLYAKPGSQQVTGIFQDSDAFIKGEHYNGHGFLFAPFTEGHPLVFLQADRQFIAEITPDLTTKHAEAVSQKNDQDEEARNRHLLLIRQALEVLRSGELEKVVLSRKITVSGRREDAPRIFYTLLHSYPSAFRYLWYHPKVGLWTGATPETLLRIKEGKLETMSLAGTQPYNGNMDVIWGVKEKEEQEIVTRSILQKLNPYVTATMAGATVTVKAGRLLHLMTPIQAELAAGHHHLQDIIKALHPTPAVCGLPREKARSFILNNEGYDRKYYTGYLGPVGEKGEAEFYVNLRCMEVENTSCTIYVGGGITRDSDPPSEWEETVNKSKTMLALF